MEGHQLWLVSMGFIGGLWLVSLLVSMMRLLMEQGQSGIRACREEVTVSTVFFGGSLFIMFLSETFEFEVAMFLWHWR
jgi:hypothetical protein